MKKLILYALISLIANLGFILGIVVIFRDKVEIEFHIEESVLIVSFSIFFISILMISRILSEILGEATSKYILKILSGLLVYNLSLNIFTLIRAMWNIWKYNDEIFNCKFFTLYYKYSKKELLSFIDYYYEEISTQPRRLTLKERAKILGDSTTIRELREKIEAYCDYEANSWWFKLWNICENSINDHPWLIVWVISGLTVVIAYPIWCYIKNTFNIQKVAVSDLNESISHLNNSSQSLITAINSIRTSIVIQGDTQKVIIKILADYFNFNISLIDTNELSAETEQKYREAWLTSFLERVAKLVDPEKVSDNTQITFTGEVL